MNKPIGTGWEIDWGHPLARGLQVCIVDSLHDLASGVQHTVIGNDVINPTGGMYLDNTTNRIDLEKQPDTSGDFTVLHRCSSNSGSGVPGWISDNGLSTAGGYQLFYSDTSNYIRARIDDVGTNGVAWDSNTNTISGTKNDVVLRKDTSTTALYIDGVFDSSQNTSGYGSTAGTLSKLRIGLKDSEVSPLDGYIDYTYIYDRALSPTEIKSLHENPYQFLKQRKSINTNELSTLLAPMPTANDDTDTVDRGVSDIVTGNVLTNDDITCP